MKTRDFTSFEQSKRLLDLGVKEETSNAVAHNDKGEEYPCWSPANIWDMIPAVFTDEDGTHSVIVIGKKSEYMDLDNKFCASDDLLENLINVIEYLINTGQFDE